MNRSPAWLFLAISLIGGCGGGQSRTSGPSIATASIPIGAFGKIRDWRADGTTGIFVEADSRKWYHMTFVTPCLILPSAGHIEFRHLPPYPVDKFDSIQVYDDVCYFKTLNEAAGPPFG
jgi:hypothetical protein